MKLDDVAALLQKCGLDEKEARAFVHLTNLGPAKVTDLATAAELKRAETYQILERLQGRGLVEGTLERPRMFTAMPPDRAVALLVEERERELRSVEGLAEEVERRLGSIATATTEASTGSFRILQDLNQIVGQLKRTFHGAKREILAIASGRSLDRLLLDEGLEEELRRAHASGVRIRILTEVQPGQEDLVARLSAVAEVRHAMVPRPLRFFVADDLEIVQYVTADPVSGNAKETALWIGASDHAQAQRAFLDDLWANAIPVGARLDELKTGRPAPQVQLVKGRFTRYEKQKEMLVRAERQVLAVLSAGDAERLEKSGMKRAFEARARAGLAVRLLVPEGAPVPKLAGVEVRRVGALEGVPTLVVDDSEALLVFASDVETSDVTALDESATWVTMRGPVAAVGRRLEAAWTRAAP